MELNDGVFEGEVNSEYQLVLNSDLYYLLIILDLPELRSIISRGTAFHCASIVDICCNEYYEVLSRSSQTSST